MASALSASGNDVSPSTDARKYPIGRILLIVAGIVVLVMIALDTASSQQPHRINFEDRIFARPRSATPLGRKNGLDHTHDSDRDGASNEERREFVVE